MTLHEIEETLATLESRHERLDEAMLVTLLRAGGWEEKDIEDAKTLFNGRGSSSFSAPQQEAIQALPDGIDPSHLLADHNEAVPEIIEQPKVEEPASLVMEREPVRQYAKKEELPHNLPLRPFETSDHVWPFSRYKDVFYGEAEEVPPPPIAVPPQPPQEAARIEPTQPLPVIQNAHSTPPVARMPTFNPLPSAKPSAQKSEHGEDKLVMLASLMLLAVLLLLGYMYKNGRL